MHPLFSSWVFALHDAAHAFGVAIGEVVLIREPIVVPRVLLVIPCADLGAPPIFINTLGDDDLWVVQVEHGVGRFDMRPIKGIELFKHAGVFRSPPFKSRVESSNQYESLAGHNLTECTIDMAPS